MIKEFQTYLQVNKGYSENTAIAYGKDLHSFARFLIDTKQDARWSTVTLADIDSYMEMMTDAKRTPATINRHVSSIRAYYNFLKRQGLMKENPARYAQQQKRQRKLCNTIPTGDLIAAQKHATGTVKVMLTLLVGTGIRLQEMLDIKKSDIEASENRIKIDGKGQKQRYVYLTKEAQETVTEYAKYSGFKLFGDITQRQVRMAIYLELRRFSQARQLSPHAIRHTFATNMAKNGANVATIQKVLGHESIKTTQKYIDLAQIDVREQILQFSKM